MPTKAVIHVINGPNLNLVGTRETSIYGTKSMDDVIQDLIDTNPEEIRYFQSNHEGDIIDYLHEHGFDQTGFVLNAGAYTHYSYAIADAIKAITAPVVEMHISDLSKREKFRQVSVIRENCAMVISGLGTDGYQKAVDYLKPIVAPKS